MNDPVQPGEALTGAYIVQQHLNRGNVYDVYSVWSSERDCLCIAKRLRPDQADDPAKQGRLIQEGRYLTGFTHPHIVRGYEMITDETSTGPIVITETLTGVTLSRLIQDNTPHGLNPSDAAQLGRQLCAALHYLHRHELVHLDVKPSNTICVDGRAVVLDIDLAQSPGPCRAGVGTAEYMAPEQITGDPVNYSADIWGLGGVLYRALTSHRPFPRKTADRRIEDTADLSRLDRPGISPAFRRLITGCLTVAPAQRPPLDTVRQALDAILASATPVWRDPPCSGWAVRTGRGR